MGNAAEDKQRMQAVVAGLSKAEVDELLGDLSNEEEKHQVVEAWQLAQGGRAQGAKGSESKRGGGAKAKAGKRSSFGDGSDSEESESDRPVKERGDYSFYDPSKSGGRLAGESSEEEKGGKRSRTMDLFADENLGWGAAKKFAKVASGGKEPAVVKQAREKAAKKRATADQEEADNQEAIREAEEREASRGASRNVHRSAGARRQGFRQRAPAEATSGASAQAKLGAAKRSETLRRLRESAPSLGDDLGGSRGHSGAKKKVKAGGKGGGGRMPKLDSGGLK